MRDLTPVVARVKRSGATVVTTGGEPVMLADKSAAVLLGKSGWYALTRRRRWNAPVPARSRPRRCQIAYLDDLCCWPCLRKQHSNLAPMMSEPTQQTREHEVEVLRLQDAESLDRSDVRVRRQVLHQEGSWF